jgi:serine/threonine protein kinase
MAIDEVSPGQVLPGTVWRVVRLIGEGRLGRVYAVDDSTTGERFALKTLSHPRPDAPRLAERLLREARLQRELTDPRVVRIRTAGVSSDGQCFYLMDLVDGEPLGTLLRRTGKFEIDALLPFAIELSDALASVHAIGIVHRDVNPDNVLCSLGPSATPSVRLLDLGVTSATEGPGTSSRPVYGTFGYASPEQLRGEPSGPLMDIWSLGCVLYQAVCGRLPFEVSSDWRTFVDGVLGPLPAPRLSDLLPEAPADLVALLARMLQKEPSRRLPRVEMASATLRRIEHRLAGHFSSEPPDPPHGEAPATAPLNAGATDAPGPSAAPAPSSDTTPATSIHRVDEGRPSRTKLAAVAAAETADDARPSQPKMATLAGATAEERPADTKMATAAEERPADTKMATAAEATAEERQSRTKMATLAGATAEERPSRGKIAARPAPPREETPSITASTLNAPAPTRRAPPAPIAPPGASAPHLDRDLRMTYVVLLLSVLLAWLSVAAVFLHFTHARRARGQ